MSARLRRYGQYWTAVVSLLAACHGWAQLAELGPAPRLELEQMPALAAKDQPRQSASGNWYDTANRAAVRDAYNNVFAPTNSAVMGWTGSVSGCIAGETSQAWKDAVAARINWFRGMAGVPMGITLNASWNAKDQQAALMMSANKALSHSPPSNWLCYTGEGAEAAGKSNLCYLWGYGNTDPGCVALYMRDDGANNAAVGHRRWILYPHSTQMGTGDVAESAGAYPRTNGMWVIGGFLSSRPATRESFVAWPPKGYVPYQVIPSRWSFSYAGANFSNATVTMTRNGVNVPVQLEPVANGYGDNTLVWVPTTPQNANPGASDAVVDVTVSNVGVGGTSQSFQYQVIIMDPAASSGGTSIQVTLNTSPQGLTVLVDGSPATAPATFTWTGGATHTISVPSPQTVGGTRYLFSSWNHGGPQTQTISPAANTSYTANFNAEHLLTLAVTPAGGGTVSASPSSSSGYYPSGTAVQLSAAANPGFQFRGWSGAISGSENPATVVVSSPTSVTAEFLAVGACAYALNSSGVSVSGFGEIGFFDLLTSAGCSWSAASNANWITISSAASGSGSARVRYQIAANPSNTARAGAITVAGLTFTAHQMGASCTMNVTPQHTTLSPAGGPATVTAMSEAGCNWTPFSAVPWITFNTGASSGSASVSYAATANSGANPRTGSLSIGGQIVQVLQKGTGPQQFFTDVSATHPFFDYVTLLRLNNVTSGCSASSYCPDATTTRGQMAVFIIRSLLGDDFLYPATPYFSDVPASHTFFKYVQKMRELGITSGCAATSYCPDDPVTRGQMAVFLIRGRLGLSGAQPFPHAPTPYFADVAANHPFFSAIQKMKELGITSGCSAIQYCPDQPTTRGQMAVFLIRAFYTP